MERRRGMIGVKPAFSLGLRLGFKFLLGLGLRLGLGFILGFVYCFGLGFQTAICAKCFLGIM